MVLGFKFLLTFLLTLCICLGIDSYCAENKKQVPYLVEVVGVGSLFAVVAVMFYLIWVW